MAIIMPIRFREHSAARMFARGAVVAGNLLREADQTMGFNAQTDKYEHLIQSGVIDPTKVVRSALQDAASLAGLLITTEAAINGHCRREARYAGRRNGHGRYGLLSQVMSSRF
jgi:chaperonin GroEL